MRSPCIVSLSLILLACSSTPAGPGSEDESPTGIIYFEYDLPGVGNPSAWQVNPDGSDLKRVPHAFDRVSTPHVGLSGRWLAYSESGDIFMNDLTNPSGWSELPYHDITSLGRRLYPLVSPSGRLVANSYKGPDPALWGVWISRNDQSWVETLLEPIGEQFGEQRAIGWFPGEDSLLVLEWGRHYKYFIVHTDGSGRREPDVPGISNFLRAVLSPTGRYIALAGPLGADPSDPESRRVAIHEMATGKLVQVVELPDPISEVLWSPDERYLAYVPFPTVADQFDLAVVDLSSEGRTIILDVPWFIRFPVWVKSPPTATSAGLE